jgi:hypothetical protein
MRSKNVVNEEDVKNQFQEQVKSRLTRGLQQAKWEEDAYRDKMGSFNVMNYDTGDLSVTSNTYTMSAAMSGE